MSSVTLPFNSLMESLVAASAVGPGVAFSVPVTCSSFSLQCSLGNNSGTNATSCVVYLQGSNNGVDWFTLTAATWTLGTVATGAMTFSGSGFPIGMVRAYLQTFSGGTNAFVNAYIGVG